MKIFGFSDSRAPVAVLTRTDSYSEGKIIRKTGGLLIANTPYPCNVSRFNRVHIGVVSLWIASVGQIETAPALTKNGQIAALSESFQKCGEGILLRGDNAKLSFKQLCKWHFFIVCERGAARCGT